MSEETPKESTLVKISDLPRQRSGHFVSVYANHVEAAPSFYDLALTFCQIGPDAQAKRVIEQHATVTLSWEHILRVRDLLTKLIDRYEEGQGKIRLFTEPSEVPTDE